MLAGGSPNLVYAEPELPGTFLRGAAPQGQGRSVRSVPPTRRCSRCALVLLTIVFLIISASAWQTICGALRSNARAPGLGRRSLADNEGGGDEEELSRLLDMCVEWEEELGVLGGAAGSEDSAEGEPQAKRARLEVVGFEAADKFEGEGGRGEAGPVVVSSLPVVQPLGAAATVGSAVQGVSLSVSDESATAPALASLPHAGAWLDYIADILPEAEQHSSAEGCTGSPPDDEAPSTSAAARAALNSGEEKSDGNLRSHPYVHLPVVLPQVIQKPLDIAALLKATSPRASLLRPLSIMRFLFLKPMLDAEDVKLLAHAIAALVNHAREYLAQPPRHRTEYDILALLARLFMVFDCLACAIEILGANMKLEQWWESFASLFRTDYALQGSTFAVNLAARLSKALTIYKRGARPELREVVEIKRILFLSPHVKIFRGRCWTPWMKDGE